MTTVRLICILAVITAALVSGHRDRYFWKFFTNIRYTVENELTDNPFNGRIRVVQPRGSVFLKFMRRAAAKRDIFKFTCKEFEKLGCFVEEINGLTGNTTERTFWAFIRRDKDTGDCLQNVGVSTYVPKPREHLVLSFKTYDVFNELPNCETGDIGSH